MFSSYNFLFYVNGFLPHGSPPKYCYHLKWPNDAPISFDKENLNPSFVWSLYKAVIEGSATTAAQGVVRGNGWNARSQSRFGYIMYLFKGWNNIRMIMSINQW